MDLSRFARRRYTEGATPIEPAPRFSAALAATCPSGRGPAVWIKRDDLLGPFRATTRRASSGRRCAGRRRRHADHLRCAAIESLPHHAGGGGEGGVELPLRDGGACARQLPRRRQRQPLHVPPAGRRGDHRGAGRQRHGGCDARRRRRAGAPGPQGLCHPRRWVERDRLLAAQVLGAQRAHGRGGAAAGAQRWHPARLTPAR